MQFWWNWISWFFFCQTSLIYLIFSINLLIFNQMLFEKYIIFLLFLLLSIINQTLMNIGYILENKKWMFKFYITVHIFIYISLYFNIHEDRTNKWIQQLISIFSTRHILLSIFSVTNKICNTLGFVSNIVKNICIEVSMVVYFNKSLYKILGHWLLMSFDYF